MRLLRIKFFDAEGEPIKGPYKPVVESVSYLVGGTRYLV